MKALLLLVCSYLSTLLERRVLDSAEAETSIYNIQRYMVSLSLPHSCVLVIVGSHTDGNVCMYHNI